MPSQGGNPRRQTTVSVVAWAQFFHVRRPRWRRNCGQGLPDTAKLPNLGLRRIDDAFFQIGQKMLRQSSAFPSLWSIANISPLLGIPDGLHPVRDDRRPTCGRIGDRSQQAAHLGVLFAFGLLPLAEEETWTV
jgi:hypothetical protein